MTKDEIFAAWAPETSPWSRWAKPVAFAHIDLAEAVQPPTETSDDVVWTPPTDGRAALVIDLPGAESVRMGLAMAEHGFQPVVLYNAVPLPSRSAADSTEHASVAVVDMLPILDALKSGAVLLQLLHIPPTAPPAFLLDANRRGDNQGVNPQDFDNRSISFTSDFPSANFLVAQGIHRAILMQSERSDPQPDLAHSLRRWQDGGIQLERIGLRPLTTPESFNVARPRWYGAMFQRVLSSLGLRHAWGGGFGAWMPDSAGSG